MSSDVQVKYGRRWRRDLNEVDIELAMLRGQYYGSAGPVPHYKALQKLLWPDDDVHRWSELAIENLCTNTITVLMGPSDSGKTYPTAKWGLMEYWIDPDNTLVLVSSTDVRGLELRVWGAMKDLFNAAKRRWPALEGNAIDHKLTITTDKLGPRNNEEARVLRKGIICIPCMQSGKYVGLGKYVGVKQKRLRQIADECQLMGSSFLDAVPNYLGKDYRGAFLGNPLDISDPLGKMAEPECGWTDWPEPKVTTVWTTRMFNGKCVNYVGTDSPNYDHPQDQPPRYPYMISWLKVNSVRSFWGEDSIQFFSQCKGVMRAGLVGHRIITAELCRQHNTSAPAIWKSSEITQVYALDPSYGGEDRCVGGKVEFGMDVNGQQIIKVFPPTVYAVIPGKALKPEDQIAMKMKDDLAIYGIPPRNAFYDPYGKGTIGYALSQIFAAESPIPVDTGGKATDRPVRHDLYIYDKKLQAKRLKRCNEHYTRFSAEAWFSVRYVIECGQMRELPPSVRDDGTLREYGFRGNLIDIEGKDITRERMGRSPDLFDWLAIAVEGCRQRGFQIKGERGALIENIAKSDPIMDLAARWNKALEEALLVH